MQIKLFFFHCLPSAAFHFSATEDNARLSCGVASSGNKIFVFWQMKTASTISLSEWVWAELWHCEDWGLGREADKRTCLLRQDNTWWCFFIPELQSFTSLQRSCLRTKTLTFAFVIFYQKERKSQINKDKEQICDPKFCNWFFYYHYHVLALMHIYFCCVWQVETNIYTQR